MTDDIDKTMDTMGGDEPTNTRNHAGGNMLLRRYRIEGLLGEGGMGRVYRCFDTLSSIYVAIKRVPDALATNPVEMKSIRENFALIARLNHPNIANIKNLERDEKSGEYFIVMELVEGQDLRDFAKTMKLGELIPVIRDIASALDYAHRERIIHRDIKPRNVRIDPKGNVKILDFGIASQFHDSMTRIGARHEETSGTGPYMSPEQWLGEEQDARSDQYSLAILAYEMVVGRPPFLASDLSVLRTMVLQNEVQKPKEVGAQAWTAFAKALSKKREDRYTSCGALVADLERGHRQDGLPKGAGNGAAQQVSVIEAKKAPRKGLRLAAVGALVAVVVAAIMLALALDEEHVAEPAPHPTPPTRPIQPVAAPVTPEPAPPAPVPAPVEVVVAKPVPEPTVEPVPVVEEPVTVKVEEPKKPVGSVAIRTRPTGAEVTLRGVTRTSPAVFEDVPVGEYALAVTHPDREELIELVLVEDGIVTRRTFDLPRPTPPADEPALTTLTAVLGEPAVVTGDAESPEFPAAPAKPRLVVVPAAYAADLESRLMREAAEQFGLSAPQWLENTRFTGYLVSSVVSADRFDVLERTFINDALKELKLSETDLADPARAVKVGHVLNAQYLLIPTIRHVSLTKDERHIAAANETMVRLQGEMTIGLRMVDVATTRIISDREVVARVQRMGTAGRTDVAREAEALGRELYIAGARRAAMTIMGLYFPMRIAQVGDNGIVVDQGRGLVEKGDRFEVLRADSRDANTADGLPVGEIEITQVRDGMAEARIVSGTDFVAGMICREKEMPVNPLLMR